MSRIGKMPVLVPQGVKCELAGSHLRIAGPMGALERDFVSDISIEVGDGEIIVTRSDDKTKVRALHGLTRALIQNMVTGVSKGYEKILMVTGVGYRASIQGKNLNLALGYSHPISIEPPEGITFAIDGAQTIKVSGIDKELVGQVSADIRALRPPEPYKGKGIRYSDEHVVRKVSKSAGK